MSKHEFTSTAELTTLRIFTEDLFSSYSFIHFSISSSVVCISLGLLGHIMCRGLPNALFFVAAAGTRTQTVAMPTWCTNALTRFGTRQHSQYISLLRTISRSQFTFHIVILSWFITTIQRETILYKIVFYFRE